MDCTVVRYGELGVKGQSVRRRMETRLRENIAAALESDGISGSVERRHGRLVVHTTAPEAAARAVTAVPGVASASPAVRVSPEAAEIEAALADLARGREFDSYAVRASRARDDHPFTSPELEQSGGAAVGEVTDATVDLEAPAVTFEADVRPDVAYVFAARHEGPGGLPVGTQAPLVALVSGGIDSPVAAAEMLRRGAPVIPVYVDLGDYGGVDHRARAISTCERLAARAPNTDCRPYVVDGGDTLDDIASALDRGRMLSVRRYFFAVAEAIAEIEDAAGIVTGEALGQKSSQTARNLQVTSAAVELPVHRPLLSMDKPEITERARKLGTYEEATIQAGCNRLAPDTPETDGRLEKLRDLEPDNLLERAREDALAATRVSLSDA
ncbi:ThiI-type thiouridine biosynthesis protein [Natronomonas pharaonis DSM 2160]|uniref:Probable tRNA sulfurtransferase n=1 Tax=Natronomonas pharaonis (strain ATCC 35678 / DSM 2160 / CIP 103997 / JCM 8858 / NBRC 14720 / NCIMB 2260 / Gabara) TaxID=348780 RepID=A0A1U7EXS0_NATPD|nr:tRNA sulfurtransferase [Natronomonas pharaonis]CAI49982.1 ThiI-type thiouridine biosynthesis protein [Natronomonas pharaonis DSM 2160]